MTAPENTASKDSSGKKVLKWIGLAGAGIGGWALSRAFGAAFWIPILAIAGTWFVLNKLKVHPRLVPLFAIILGHMIWLGAGMLILMSIGPVPAEKMAMTFAEVAIVAALVVWVVKRHSTVAISLLLLIEVLGLTVLVDIGSQPRAMVAYVIMHAALRIAGIVAAIYVLVGRKQLVPMQASTG